MPWTVYCHTHVESGRRYIGMTAQTWQKRWKNHCNAAKYSKNGRWHFPNAIRKYGPQAFSHEVLEVCHDLEVANLAEDCWIEFYDTRNPEKGFNIEKGGQHRPHPIRKNPWSDPEYRKKLDPTLSMKATQTPEARRKNALTLSSPEVRARWSAASKQMWTDPVYKEKMRSISRSHPSIRAARDRRSREAKEAHAAKTHHKCKKHGPIPVAECYLRRSSHGTMYYSCKRCVGEKSASYRESKL